MEKPLSKLKPGESGIIVSIIISKNPQRQHRHRWGQYRWRFRKRLEDMGLTPGTRVTVVKTAPFHGPVELYVRNSRLAIGKGMAERILVRLER